MKWFNKNFLIITITTFLVLVVSNNLYAERKTQRVNRDNQSVNWIIDDSKPDSGLRTNVQKISEVTGEGHAGRFGSIYGREQSLITADTCESKESSSSGLGSLIKGVGSIIKYGAKYALPFYGMYLAGQNAYNHYKLKKTLIDNVTSQRHGTIQNADALLTPSWNLNNALAIAMAGAGTGAGFGANFGISLGVGAGASTGTNSNSFFDAGYQAGIGVRAGMGTNNSSNIQQFLNSNSRYVGRSSFTGNTNGCYYCTPISQMQNNNSRFNNFRMQQSWNNNNYSNYNNNYSNYNNNYSNYSNTPRLPGGFY